ncbi:MAG: sigma-70 family RNA polymerase sigma factor [Bacteroidetes bacterium]|nr:sigma-70 family RNA polymerase sigma factor [Bacteroidota bacterium]
MNKTENADLFLSIIQCNKGIIYKIANMYCKNVEDRQDLFQEIITQLWKSFDNYNNNFKHSTWIYRISLNVAISYYRKEKARKKINSPFSDSLFNIEGDFEDNKLLEQNTLILNQFISELKELEKALMLLYLEEKSHKEMAEIIGITETNIATKIGRIKTRLKLKFLQKEI